MTPNAELAYRVLDYIEAHPEQHDQSTFLSTDAGLVTLESFPCGTTACFAGWTVLLTGNELVVNPFGRQQAKTGDNVLTSDVDDCAAWLLGLTDLGGVDRLFYEATTLDDVREAVAELFGPRPVGDVAEWVRAHQPEREQ